MELVLVRHGQAEHTLNVPESLHLLDPALTENGIIQAESLRNQWPLSDTDIIVISPIRRALQTAEIWSEKIKCQTLVSPLVSPRMFPQKQASQTLPCDKILTKEQIMNEFSSFTIGDQVPHRIWIEGINTLPDHEFRSLAIDFLNWCRQRSYNRIYIVSHDGTITSYRQLCSGQKLTRNDFPKETGWCKLDC